MMGDAPPGQAWGALVALEPRLDALRRRAVACRGGCWREWSQIVGGLREIIGWYAETDRPALRTSDAYNVCYDVLLNAIGL